MATPEYRRQLRVPGHHSTTGAGPARKCGVNLGGLPTDPFCLVDELLTYLSPGLGQRPPVSVGGQLHQLARIFDRPPGGGGQPLDVQSLQCNEIVVPHHAGGEPVDRLVVAHPPPPVGIGQHPHLLTALARRHAGAADPALLALDLAVVQFPPLPVLPIAGNHPGDAQSHIQPHRAARGAFSTLKPSDTVQHRPSRVIRSVASCATGGISRPLSLSSRSGNPLR